MEKICDRDIFLLIASVNDVFVSKAFIKKLYEQHKDLSFLLSSDLGNGGFKFAFEEKERINNLKTEISKLELEKIKSILEQKQIEYVAYCDADYPLKLKAIIDSPSVLFYKGNISLLNQIKSVAVVGTRNATNYGLNTTKKISSFFAEQNILVVSGLASGIDTSAHKGAVSSGKTVAVVGTGVDTVFPSSNKGLFNEILEKGGLIVSEYPPSTPAMPWNFPQRNRIISALSDAVIVIEGDLQSGALITARFAIKQGKPLFALPGPIDSPVSNGPNVLIKSRSAELLTSIQDVLEVMGESKQVKFDFKEKDADMSELNEKQKVIYKCLSSKPKNFDSILSETGLEVQDITMNLSILELKGFIEKTVSGGYIKC